MKQKMVGIRSDPEGYISTCEGINIIGGFNAFG